MTDLITPQNGVLTASALFLAYLWRDKLKSFLPNRQPEESEEPTVKPALDYSQDHDIIDLQAVKTIQARAARINSLSLTKAAQLCLDNFFDYNRSDTPQDE